MTAQERQELDEKILNVKRAKAKQWFADSCQTYGSRAAALRAVNCVAETDYINMVLPVIPVSIFKRDGKVIIQ